MDTSSIRILVAEDSLTQASFLRNLLQRGGFTVTVARNGVEALDWLAGHTPDIVVSDIIMPEMDGYELCKRIKSRDATKNIPVLLLTRLSATEDVILGLECLADGFMTKPYSEEGLLTRINDMLLNAELRKHSSEDEPIHVFYGGKKYVITSGRIQIFDLLISTYESTLQKTKELEKAMRELKAAHDHIRTLKGLIPICAWCKKVLDDKGSWKQLEVYIHEHSEADFTHGLCPECRQKMYAEFTREMR